MGRIGAEVQSPPSMPPNADASVASTSGFDAATTRAALPGFGAEVQSPPSAPPNADASLAPTSGFDAATTRAALPGFGAEVQSPPRASDAGLLGRRWVRRSHRGLACSAPRCSPLAPPTPTPPGEWVRRSHHEGGFVWFRRRGAIAPLGASKRRRLLGIGEWVRRSHHKGGVAWFRRRGAIAPLGASKRRRLLGIDEWVRRRHPEGDDA